MALIKCPDCGREMSDHAPSCPQCGRPMGVVTVELTSKKWKKYKLIGGVMFVIGFLMIISNISGNNLILSVLGVLIVLTGIVLGIIGRFGAWWHNA